MPTLARRRWVAIAFAALAGAPCGALAQVQTPDQRACSAAMDKALAGVSAATTRGLASCVRDASRAKLAPGTGVEACAAADPGGKVAKALGRTESSFDAKCVGNGNRPPGSPKLPPYGVTGVAAVNAEAAGGGLALVHDLLGDELDPAVLLEAAGKDAARCQQLAVGEAGACHAARLRAYDRCKKAGLKRQTAPFDDAADLAGCFGDDPKGAIAKRCTTAMEAKLRKACEAKGVDLAGALPGCGAGGVAATRACIDRAAACRACETVAAAEGVELDCDLEDDGAANASCGVTGIGSLSCPLDPDTSGFFLESDTVFFGDVLAGSITLDCGAVDASTGVAGCDCAIDAIAPIETAGGQWACISPVAGCPTGAIACNGGPSLDATITADHDIGTCTDNGSCAADCAAHCFASGTSIWDSGCEGFCEGGSADGNACTADAQCPGGSCNGVVGAGHGNVCQCQCLGLDGAPSVAGGLRCNLGARIRIEEALPCDGTDVFYDTGDRCLPLTTQASQATLVDRDHIAGEILPSGVSVFDGVPVSCATLSESGPAGMLLFSTVNTFDVPLTGDSYLVFGLGCE
jgi:hypothetical protein